MVSLVENLLRFSPCLLYIILKPSNKLDFIDWIVQDALWILLFVIVGEGLAQVFKRYIRK